MKPIEITEKRASELINGLVNRLMQGYSFPGGRIAGEDIPEFSPHMQINNFVLFQIYQDWYSQMGRLEHPYFDFGHVDVKRAQNRFFNVVSQHISVSREDFRSMLAKAIFNTMRLILNPKDALQKFFFLNGDRIPIELFKKHSHYFSDFDFILQSIQKYYDKNDLKQVESSVFFTLFDKVLGIFESKEGKSIRIYQGYLLEKAFSVKLEELEAAQEKKPPVVVAPVNRVIEKKPEAKAPAEPLEETPRIEQERPVVQPISKPVSQPEEPTKEEQVIAPKPEPNKKVESPSGEKGTGALNERFAREKDQPTVQSKIAAPKDGLSIVEKYRQKLTQNRPNTTGNEPVTPLTTSVTPVDKSIKEALPPVEKPKVNRFFTAPEKEKPVMAPVKKETTVPPETEEPEDTSEEKKPQPIDLFSSRKVEQPIETIATPLDKVASEKKTVIDQLKGNTADPKESIAESLTPGQKTDFDTIPVHKKFQFIQSIFGGSSVKYKVVIEKLETAKSYEEAKDILNRYVFNSPDTNKETNVAKEFFGIVRGRF